MEFESPKSGKQDDSLHSVAGFAFVQELLGKVERKETPTGVAVATLRSELRRVQLGFFVGDAEVMLPENEVDFGSFLRTRRSYIEQLESTLLELEEIDSIGIADEIADPKQKELAPLRWNGATAAFWQVFDLLKSEKLISGTRKNWGAHFLDAKGEPFAGDGSQNLQKAGPLTPSLVRKIAKIAEETDGKE